MRPRHQCIEIGQRAEDRVDSAIVGDVVSKVAHRRREEGRNPDGVRAQAGDMLQSLGDAGQIADAVAIAVLKTARINLVDDGAFPPGQVGRTWIRDHGIFQSIQGWAAQTA